MDTPCLCRTCKRKDATDRGRCDGCNQQLAVWLAGGVHYTPRFNGVVAEPDPGLPMDRLTRALRRRDDD